MTSGLQSSVFCQCCVIVYPFELCKKKIANQKAAIIQPNNALDHKRNKNAVVAGVGRLNFLVVQNLSLLKLKN